MIAYIVGTCAKGIVYNRSRSVVKGYVKKRAAGFLLEEDARPFDLLAAQRAEEVRYEPIHQLEIGGQRRRVLLSVVENLLAIALGVHRRARPAVDEDELRAE